MTPPTIPLEQRFWAHVEKTDGCWLWTGNTDSYGYGRINRGGSDGKHLSTHRVSWEMARGPIPEGLMVLHRCDVPACVRPDHLFTGDASANSHDMVFKGRSKTRARVHGDLVNEKLQRLGERHGMAKLTANDVRAIRAAYTDGETQAAISRRFRVNQAHVSDIVHREVWKHVV